MRWRSMILGAWLAGCGSGSATGTDGATDVPLADGATSDNGPVEAPCTESAVDMLLLIDNSKMRDNQTLFMGQFPLLLDALVNPPRDPSAGRPVRTPVQSLHLGVVSSDLGTPGSTVPSCFNSDLGDDGLINPIRQGQAIRGHQPWTTAQPGNRPARCTMDPNQYPTFLVFTANSSDAAGFAEDVACNGFLSVGGCGLEQQLESVYRALVVHDPRAQLGNSDPNAGFVRPHAVLALVVLSDEEDGSTRDCRYAERDARGQPMACTDATTVFDSTSSSWSSSDLNLRFYMYAPGSPQDPTWSLSRYVDPTRPDRGYLSLKPGHPERVVFATLTGVPINMPAREGGSGVDWDALLGRNPDGSDGYTGMSVEGPVSMRQRNMDPTCTTRVVPACRREGSRYDLMRPACDTNAQYFAWPGRRIAAVARVFDEHWSNGVIASICRNDYSDFMRQLADRIGSRVCTPGS